MTEIVHVHPPVKKHYTLDEIRVECTVRFAQLKRGEAVQPNTDMARIYAMILSLADELMKARDGKA